MTWRNRAAHALFRSQPQRGTDLHGHHRGTQDRRIGGAVPTLVSLEAGEIQAMQEDVHAAGRYAVDSTVSNARSNDFDGLALRGRTTDPDKLRVDDDAVAFVKGFVDSDKPIAAVFDGAWVPIKAGGVGGHTLAFWPSLQTDLRNAGPTWVDETVVRDGKLVTARTVKDLPA